jgi:hypothetical protein
MMFAASGGGSALASWVPLYLMLGAFAAIVIALGAFGRSGSTRSRSVVFLVRIADGLERVTGIPGWAATAVGTSLFGLLVAGQGFYSDVAWHVGLGRDEELFTAPHTGIVVGLFLILLAAVLGTLVASIREVDTSLRWRAVRVPWSMVPLFALGVAAVSGFPLDELWHREYGVDVTMWSPTHMLMILGATFTGAAAWLVLAEARVRPTDSRWARGVHVVAAWFTLQALAAPLGEFSFGVPQFQQLFHPLLLTIAAAFGLIVARLVLGRWWALGIAAVNMLLMQGGLLETDRGPVSTRSVGLFIVSAAVVELVAQLVGTRDRLRFALVSGLGVGTIGLAGEWLWNQGAYQPWDTPLLVPALVFCTIAGVAAAVLAVAFTRTHDRDTPPVARPLVAAAGAALFLLVALPLPRPAGNVTATTHVEPAGTGNVNVEVTLDPPDAAQDARWFQASAWQGGGLVLADMREVGPGRYVTEEPVPVAGGWKTIVRLHRGGELMAVPIYLPADPEIGEQEIPAVDRTQAFEPERKYLLRETHPGNAWFTYLIHGLLLAAIAVWAVAFVLAVRGTAGGAVRGRRPRRRVEPAPA